MSQEPGSQGAAPSGLAQRIRCGLIQNPSEFHLFHTLGAEVSVKLWAQRPLDKETIQQPDFSRLAGQGSEPALGASKAGRVPGAALSGLGAWPAQCQPSVAASAN